MSEQDAAPQVGETYPLSTLRHSVAHLMASAVGKLYPGVQFGIGPSIEHGFYYDFEFPEPMTEKDLKRIEKEMYKTARKDAEISCESLTRDQARERLLANLNPRAVSWGRCWGGVVALVINTFGGRAYAYGNFSALQWNK